MYARKQEALIHELIEAREEIYDDFYNGCELIWELCFSREVDFTVRT